MEPGIVVEVRICPVLGKAGHDIDEGGSLEHIIYLGLGLEHVYTLDIAESYRQHIDGFPVKRAEAGEFNSYRS